MSKTNKRIKAARLAAFKTGILPLIRAKYIVEERPNKSFTVYETGFGTIDLWPTADKVCIRVHNQWIPGLSNWIEENLRLGS